MVLAEDGDAVVRNAAAKAPHTCLTMVVGPSHAAMSPTLLTVTVTDVSPSHAKPVAGGAAVASACSQGSVSKS